LTEFCLFSILQKQIWINPQFLILLFMRLLLLPVFLLLSLLSQAQDIPLAEHPRPDFERQNWQNLNGTWDFAFDKQDVGQEEAWFKANADYPLQITVPFPWGSALSGLTDGADIGWYRRTIRVDESWSGQRTFLTIGASDWETTVWLDGKRLGQHQGGYVPFSFELTEYLNYGTDQNLVIRVDDARRDFTLYGKQGYGNARGIWQTVYLEARGQNYLDAVHFTPDIEADEVKVTVYLPTDAPEDLPFRLELTNTSPVIATEATLPAGAHKHSLTLSIPQAQRWTLTDPHLYEARAILGDDVVKTYFGMRKISVVDLPGTDFPYIALNNEPVYLQLALDQSYHPEGFYTFPSDQFMREEIERSKSIGLNGIRTHIKVEVPRKLYWADKLGLLVMEDLPNSWGEPDYKMQQESEYTLREMIKRDYNHPSIFSWVVFNETWGLFTDVQEEGKKKRLYLPETQDWVASMYYLAKSLDGTRLVEDNSICCGRGHTETDINSWHVYLPGYEWENYLSELVENTYEGSQHHFEEGFQQGRQPNINSECGNVWGYNGSTGDVDWSYDYHRMINSFRMYPKVGGWLYTEHHDVINEWNGYWRFDRTEKETGLGEIVSGMSLRDLHAPVYLSTGNVITQTAKGGRKVEVPMFLSVMTGKDHGKEVQIHYELETTNYIGETEKNLEGKVAVGYSAWMQKQLEPLSFRLPDVRGLAVLRLWVKDLEGNILHRNFMHFEIQSDQQIPKTACLNVAPAEMANKSATERSWTVREGRKWNAVHAGSVDITFPLTGPVDTRKAKEAYFLIEMSAKEYFVKDQEEYDRNQDFMKGSIVAPSSNPNSYPMTDETMYPSKVRIAINGQQQMTVDLPDDPADHRGVLSWHHQLENRQLREAGSYGYMIKVPVSRRLLRQALQQGELTVHLETVGNGGMAIYGKEFGRYPFAPSLVLRY
jgi:hypothetical protein